MKRRIHLFNRLFSQYQRYRRKLKRIENGNSRYRRKSMLIKRLQQLCQQLVAMNPKLKVASSGIALSVGMLMSTSGTAQNLVLKTDNPVGIANIEGKAKPVFLDWNGDGNIDMFVGGTMENVPNDSLSNGVRYYQNTGGVMLEMDSPFPSDLGIPAMLNDTAGVAPAFIDLDGDNDMDAFLGIQSGHLLYYRNDEGTMVKVDGSENPFDGVQIGGSYDAVPTFVDVDGDGDLDAVIGKYDGGLSYYKNDSGVFTEVSSGSPFESINVTESASPTFADWDGDGDMDLLIGNKDGIIEYYTNDAGVFTAVAAEMSPFMGIDVELQSAPAVADLDGDGDMDLVIGNNDGAILYYRNDEGTLVNVDPNTIGIAYDRNNTVINHGLVDIDGDSDMDLFSGELNGIVLHYVNTDGVFAATDPHPLDTRLISLPPEDFSEFARYITAPSFADIDGDGDMDAFIGTYQTGINYYSNDAGVFTLANGDTNPFNGIEAGDNESIAFVDWDGDGDMDAFIGNKVGEVKYFQNDNGVFSAAAGPLDAVSFVGQRLPNWPTHPAFADIDGDGDMDAYVGMQDGFIRVFDNDEGVLTEMTGADNPFTGMDFGRSPSLDFGDIDGDGDVDLLVGNALGQTFHFDNQEPSATRQPLFNATTSIFPNPTTGQLQMEMPWLKGEAIVEVVTISGQLVQQVAINQQQVTLNLAPLPTGMYLVRVIGENGLAVKKIMKK